MAALFIIPTSRTQTHYVQTTELDGRSYRLVLDWIQRWRRWTLGIQDVTGTELVTGKALVTGIDILAHLRHDTRLPPGPLFIQPLQGPGEAGLENLHPSGGFALCYVSP